MFDPLGQRFVITRQQDPRRPQGVAGRRGLGHQDQYVIHRRTTSHRCRHEVSIDRQSVSVRLQDQGLAQRFRQKSIAAHRFRQSPIVGPRDDQPRRVGPEHFQPTAQFDRVGRTRAVAGPLGKPIQRQLPLFRAGQVRHEVDRLLQPRHHLHPTPSPLRQKPITRHGLIP